MPVPVYLYLSMTMPIRVCVLYVDLCGPVSAYARVCLS